MTPAHWTDVLTLREEVRQTDGSVGELQMSLAKAVYQTVPVPYSRCDYYTDITQPTPLLVGFLARVVRRLGVARLDTHACFHLDQGMGGGKSHALVGIWHMVHTPEAFFRSELGQVVAAEAGAGGHTVELDNVVPVVLIGDSMSPGRTDPRFGPATDLFGRMVWLAFDGHADRMDRWQHYTTRGANKATLQEMFAELSKPVLIVIDELMDYAMALTNQDAIGGLPGEQAFLSALADAVDDQPQVALIVVMISSDADEAGYHPAAEELREYFGARLRRNGETVTVTGPADFAQIIRRRLFNRADVTAAAAAVANQLVASIDGPWNDNVFAKLGSGRGVPRLPERVGETYPFHPDLFELVAKEWSVVQAFQRVRSSVAIFARTVLHWATEREAGRWAPELVGPGDIPLQTDALEALLSSGVLAGSDRAVQGYRAVANTDVIRPGGGGGTAYQLDQTLAAAGVVTAQPAPAVRLATACFGYSLVPRAKGARGATKAELLAAIHGPGVPYAAAEEVFNGVVASPVDGGLGALETTRPAAGRGLERHYLSIKQTLNMFHATALTMVSNDDALERMWTRAQSLATKGAFSSLLFVEDLGDGAPAATCFSSVDSQENRLVVLDPRRWTLLNGKDGPTRADLDVAFGVTRGLTATYAASMVVALVNTQKRARARDRARDVIAWEGVVSQLDEENEEYGEACARRDDARRKLDAEVKQAFQHYAYVLRTATGLTVQYKPVPDGKSSLNGQDVWTELVAASRAVAAGTLSADYVAQLITAGAYGRDLTPKELFALPYGNSAWPLVATVGDMRRVVYELATSPEWMLTDSDGIEVRPDSPAQIQPNSMQQQLRPRPAGPEPTATPTGVQGAEPAAGDAPWSPPTVTVSGDGSGAGTSVTDPTGQTRYEVTKIGLPLASMTDASRREAIWGLLHELARLADPARAAAVDLQMLGFDVTVTARAGDLQGARARAQDVPGVSVTVEDDDF